MSACPKGENASLAAAGEAQLIQHSVRRLKNKQSKLQLILLGQKASHHKISISVILVLFKHHNSVTFKYSESQMF